MLQNSLISHQPFSSPIPFHPSSNSWCQPLYELNSPLNELKKKQFTVLLPFFSPSPLNCSQLHVNSLQKYLLNKNSPLLLSRIFINFFPHLQPCVASKFSLSRERETEREGGRERGWEVKEVVQAFIQK